MTASSSEFLQRRMKDIVTINLYAVPCTEGRAFIRRWPELTPIWACDYFVTFNEGTTILILVDLPLERMFRCNMGSWADETFFLLA